MRREDVLLLGALAGMAGAVAFSVLWLAAIMTDGNWVFGVETLSELGGDRPGRCFFNSGVIVMGLLAIPFGSVLYLRFNPSLIGRAAALLFTLSAIFLVGIGVFPIDTGTPHTFFSWAFFSASIISLTIMIPRFHADELLKGMGTVVTAGTVLVGYVTIALVATDIIELALSEALTVIALVIWVLMTGTLLLRATVIPDNGS